MADQYLHGAEIVEVDSGVRAIQTVKTSIIGLVGTAPDADDDVFPTDFPIVVSPNTDLTKLGETGTLAQSLSGIFDQIGAVVVMVRVATDDNDATTIANVAGSNANNVYTGVYALLGAESQVGLKPRILIAPGFSHQPTVLANLGTIANRMRAMAYVDGPNETDAKAIELAKSAGKRVYMCDPWLMVGNRMEPPSARLAGVRARVDNELGFHVPISNQVINGITGTSQPVDFTFGDKNCRANILNENHIGTIIHQGGFRAWGTRVCGTSDPKWAFENVVRSSDVMHDSLLRAHLWAVDRNINKAYLDEVPAGVNAYLRHLVSIGAILGGTCEADASLNTPENIAQGKVFFNFKYTPAYCAEHITFRSHLTHEFIQEALS
ncbi:phage tail sheath C-terminal domain-containing protein [Algicola sagamiensis]|uniref:phage tail sheath C-terminal domain-containing protein n=1 Tax=Algicola sagamiensis TaxID=163869 RepID=UPI00036EAE23|nr:phage tail sheath C-terminal domain-containing protein [Algicola sagamiensis]